MNRSTSQKVACFKQVLLCPDGFSTFFSLA